MADVGWSDKIIDIAIYSLSVTDCLSAYVLAADLCEELSVCFSPLLVLACSASSVSSGQPP